MNHTPQIWESKGDENWLCIKCRPRQERLAVEELRRNFNIEVLFPRIRRKRKIVSGTDVRIEPMFPGYAFAKLSLSDALSSIRYTRGVACIVHFGQCYPTIPAAVIAELIKNDLQSMNIEIKPNSRVTMCGGVFDGFIGTVINVGAKERVRILIEFLGSLTAVSTSADRLIPVC